MNDKFYKKPYIERERIAFWFPMSKDLEIVIENLITDTKDKEGVFVPHFQMIERCVREIARIKGLSETNRTYRPNKEYE